MLKPRIIYWVFLHTFEVEKRKCCRTDLVILLLMNWFFRAWTWFRLNNSVFTYGNKVKLQVIASWLVEKYMSKFRDQTGNEHDSDLPEYFYFWLSGYGLNCLNVERRAVWIFESTTVSCFFFSELLRTRICLFRRVSSLFCRFCPMLQSLFCAVRVENFAGLTTQFAHPLHNDSI